MDILDHFLPSNRTKAINEMLCIALLLDRFTKNTYKGDYQSAVTNIENVLRSVKELERLRTKKQQKEKIEQLVDQLGRQNVNVVLFRRDKRENNYY